jgi:hypothetical protein
MMSGVSGAPGKAPGRRPVRTAGILIVLAVVVLVFFGPRLLREFEEPPVVDVCDILRGDVASDIVLVRGIVQRQRSGQGYIFLADVDEEGEIVVDGVQMLPVVRVQSWAWFNTGQEVRLPVRITTDSAGNLLLVEARGRGGGGVRRMPDEAGGAADSAGSGQAESIPPDSGSD